MTAYLIVRADVAAPKDREAFDRWYAVEHLPDAIKAFGARHAWRGWSQVDPAIHYAFYEFGSLAAAKAATASDAIKGLIAEFDRVWGDRVTRTRDVVEKAQQLPA